MMACRVAARDLEQGDGCGVSGLISHIECEPVGPNFRSDESTAEVSARGPTRQIIEPNRGNSTQQFDIRPLLLLLLF